MFYLHKDTLNIQNAFEQRVMLSAFQMFCLFLSVSMRCYLLLSVQRYYINGPLNGQSASDKQRKPLLVTGSAYVPDVLCAFQLILKVTYNYFLLH